MGLICVSLLPNPLLNPHATSTPQPCSSTRSQSSHAPWCASPLSSQPQWLILHPLSSPPSPVPSPSPSLLLPSLGSGLQLQVELLPALSMLLLLMKVPTLRGFTTEIGETCTATNQT